MLMGGQRQHTQKREKKVHDENKNKIIAALSTKRNVNGILFCANYDVLQGNLCLNLWILFWHGPNDSTNNQIH